MTPNAVLLASCLLCAVSWADDTLKLVTGPDYPPYTDPLLKNGGLATEVVSKAAERAGWQVELSWRPWANGYQATLAGEFAATFPYVRTAEREKLFRFSDPIFELNTYVFGRAGEPLDGSRPETLKGLRYCQPLGWAVLPALLKMEKAKQLVFVRPNDMSACMKLIVLKRADFTVTDGYQGAQSIKKLPPDWPPPQALGEIMAKQTLYLIMPLKMPQSAEMMQRFNRGLQQK